MERMSIISIMLYPQDTSLTQHRFSCQLGLHALTNEALDRLGLLCAKSVRVGHRNISYTILGNARHTRQQPRAIRIGLVYAVFAGGHLIRHAGIHAHQWVHILWVAGGSDGWRVECPPGFSACLSGSCLSSSW